MDENPFNYQPTVYDIRIVSRDKLIFNARDYALTLERRDD
jgi:hypothetical protein